MSYKTITVEKQGNIALLTLNNPQVLNALSGESIAELLDAVNHLEADQNIYVVIVTGAGKAFVAGADIAYMQTMTAFEAAGFSRETTHVHEQIGISKKIYIAAINGFALGGGCELALAMDIRIASEKAKFGLPEAGLGIIPGGGGTQRLMRLVGKAQALELMVTCDTIKAEQALAMGLVNHVVPPESLMEEAHAMAEKIAQKAPKAVAMIKECMRVGEGCSLADGMEFEKNMFGLCFATEDGKEGLAAFMEKRSPAFHNK